MSVSGTWRRGLSLAPLFISALFAVLAISEETARPEEGKSVPRLALLWVGADGGASVLPPIDIETLTKSFEQHGYRVMRLDGVSPKVLSHTLLVEYKKRPEDFDDQTIPLILHGHGLLAPGDAMMLPRADGEAQYAQVSDADLMAAFLVGIGPSAKAEIARSECLVGRPCRELGLEGTPVADRVKRVMLPQMTPQEHQQLVQEQQRRQKMFEQFLDIALFAMGKVASQRADESFRFQKTPIPNLPPSTKSFQDIARREEFLSGMRKDAGAQ